LAEFQLSKPLAESRMCVLPSEFLVYMVVIDNIIAMLAARGRLQVRRTVYVRYSEFCKIIGNFGCIVKGEVFMQLYSVRSKWDSTHARVRSFSLPRQGIRYFDLDRPLELDLDRELERARDELVLRRLAADLACFESAR
jgi:hypothetical protein